MTTGLCECGCGEPAPIATYTNRRYGWVKGQPKRYIHGHQIRTRRTQSSRALTERLTGRFGADHPAWRGGRSYKEGYVLVMVGLGHPMANHQGRVLEHRLLMAETIGRMLQPEEVVHHINGVKDDNRIENLQLFSSATDHVSHHWRERRCSSSQSS